MHKITITNQELIAKLSGLQSLVNCPFPVKVTYALRKNIKMVESEYDIYYTSLTALMEKYGLDITQKEFSNNPKLDKELKELLAMPVELGVYKVPESILEGNFDMSIAQLLAMEFMIETEDTNG